jgi:hypothetical protein
MVDGDDCDLALRLEELRLIQDGHAPAGRASRTMAT